MTINSTPAATYWQKLPYVLGPLDREHYHLLSQVELRQAISKTIRERFPNARVLDVGCHTGFLGYQLFHEGFSASYLGMDNNARALVYAAENLRGFSGSVALGDIERIPFKDHFFDLTVVKDLLELLPYYEAPLKEVARVSAKGVLLSFSIKLRDSNDTIEFHPDGFYLNAYNRNKLFAYMQSLGFKAPETLFQSAEDEVLLFRRKRWGMF